MTMKQKLKRIKNIILTLYTHINPNSNNSKYLVTVDMKQDKDKTQNHCKRESTELCRDEGLRPVIIHVTNVKKAGPKTKEHSTE